MSNEPIILDQPHQIAMYRLLVLRHRLHLELKTAMRFKPSTLVAMRAMGLTDTRDRWTALYDVNQAIAASGGPADSQSLALQKLLNQVYPPKARA